MELKGVAIAFVMQNVWFFLQATVMGAWMYRGWSKRKVKRHQDMIAQALLGPGWNSQNSGTAAIPMTAVHNNPLQAP